MDIHSRNRLLVYQQKTQGFTLVEVLVSMIITLTFLMVTLQIFMAAAYLRAKTVEYDTMYDWVQEDFEQILSKAKSYEREILPFSPRCHSNTLASSFITDRTNGLGGANSDLGSRVFHSQTYALQRTVTTSGTDPSRLLNIHYDVTLADKNDTLLSIDTRVSIIAAFNCPMS